MLQMVQDRVGESVGVAVTDGITVAVNRPPVSGYNVGNNKYVEVLINRPTPTFFMRALNVATATVGARAVAGPGPGSGCMLHHGRR